jgi:hypothetical protein
MTFMVKKTPKPSRSMACAETPCSSLAAMTLATDRQPEQQNSIESGDAELPHANCEGKGRPQNAQ